MNNFVVSTENNAEDDSTSPDRNSSPSRQKKNFNSFDKTHCSVIVTPESRITGSLSRLGSTGSIGGPSVVSSGTRPTPDNMHSRMVPSSPVPDGGGNDDPNGTGAGAAGGGSPASQPFVDTMELRQEQFRIVSPPHGRLRGDQDDSSAFSYPALPLPYAQRKRLSDCLFAMSKQQSFLTDECAVVLREARESDLWDLSVAELITQVIIVLYCPEDDFRLMGLRQYLLGLGIAC
mmetsp:Transcript_35315/g.81805  ORF Transcript_35315/g.81805 Transcript_35315/m.81805 type:complete len:233 (+) Transcript_35315:2701-3399(+)